MRLGDVVSRERPYDVVLFGATGFTGALTARYLAERAPASTRWALAGRDRHRLQSLREQLAAASPRCADLPLVLADACDAGAVRALAACTRVLASAVGPYLIHGEPLVAACSAAGTDYLDITGESEFVDRMYLRYHERAAASGARLVHCCGFECVPFDLGAYFVAQQLPAGAPARLRAVLQIGLAGGADPARNFSAGSLRSALTMFSRPRERRRAARERRRREPPPPSRRVTALPALPGYERASGSWLLPMRTIDSRVVLRSAATLELYGPDFAYGQHLAVGGFSRMAGMACAAAVLFALAQFGPSRDALGRRIRADAGPSAAQREQRWFKLQLTGEGAGRRVRAEVSGGDPGYGESSKMLAEAALCLAHDEVPERFGQLTPAAAMGDALLARLRCAGISFERSPAQDSTVSLDGQR